MKNKVILLLFMAALFGGCNNTKQPADYVDPFIGTGFHGHTYPGATVPFGMVQLSPDTRLYGWDGCSGYHYSDSVIYGFSHTHLSGTGIPDYGDVLVMPTAGNYYFNNGYEKGHQNGYGSLFSHQDETASPGYYKVFLKDYNIKAELTATKRCGFHRYTYPKGQSAYLTIDLTHRDKVINSYLRVVNDYEVEGYRISSAWAKEQYVYFVMRFNHPIREFIVNGEIEHFSKVKGKNIVAVLNFGELKEPLLVKTGLSAVSIDGARKNLEAEIPDWDFWQTRTQAYKEWNNQLKKIEIKADRETKTNFYTALYHTMVVPNLFMDVDSLYRGTDLKIHKADGFDYYTVFSLWDTYRATHPLYTIIEPKRTADFINTFIAQYRNGGQLPVWELAGNYTGCMIGYHSVSVIADAFVKGIKEFDTLTAYKAMKEIAEKDELGKKYFWKYGYIPADKEPESVSKTLEYAYDNWCIAQMAKAFDNKNDYSRYIQSAQFYKNLYNPQNGFMCPKINGLWKYPFDPREVDFNYTEANSWQYTFSVQQDINGLITLMGGDDNFCRKLDELFYGESKLTGRQQADITGLIGQYAHGNEPSHHIAYLYDYAGKPWKTQEIVDSILLNMYKPTPGGLVGNEDCGQMSAWYVFSATGFYPVTPGSDIYAFGRPIVKQATFNLENGRTFTVKVINQSKENKFIQRVWLNSKPYDKGYIRHKDIMQGGTLVFEMGSEPNQYFATAKENRPVSQITDSLIVPVPYCDAKKILFDKPQKVGLYDLDTSAEIYFSTDSTNWTKYTSPLEITKTSTVYYFARKANKQSKTTLFTLYKFPEGRSVKLLLPPHPQYTAGSDSALIDGIYGGNDFRTGKWLGFQQDNLEAIIDLGKIQNVSYFSGHFLQDINSWIFMPEFVEFYYSTDGKTFRKLGRVNNDVPQDKWGVIIKDFTLRTKPVKARYIKVVAKNIGLCPSWHKGHGNGAFIFVDEITVY